jgi:S1-C subfamily serine protease
MLKKLLLTFITISSFVFALGAASADDFNSMNPTVKVTSYKKLFTDKIIAYGSGSGTVISKDGLIITNNHVIFDDNEQKPLDTFEICITFDVSKEPECKYTARLVANDKDLDVAILKINNADVFGQGVTDMKYLNYKTTSEPKEQSAVQIMGYPGSGGETITITKGQISGFDKYNGYTYFKTDTDFDHGSSGGTALDAEGNYIGIPTYIVTYSENVGYFLDIREAVTWIDAHIKDKSVFNSKAESRLIEELARLKKANETLKFTYDDYPKISVEAPAGWRFYEITDDGLYVEQEKLTDPAALSVYLYYYQYPIDEGYLKKLDEELMKLKDQYPDFKKEDIEFNGYAAISATYTSYNSRHNMIYIPYGYVLVGLNYSINLDESEKQEPAIQEILKTIKLNSKAEANPPLDQAISFADPGFSITMPEGWRMQKNMGNQPMELLAEAVQKDNFDGSLSLNYQMIPKDERELPSKDRADEETKNIGGKSKLIFKKDDAVLDGLPGWLYIYEYEGDKYQEMHKKLVFKLQNGDYEFTIEYEDLSDNFDKNIADLEAIFRSFKFTGSELERKGEYDFGSLKYNFNDIQYHRYANAITELADKGVIEGYSDGSFKPEKLVTRAEALKIILASKNKLEENKGSGKDVDFTGYDTSGITSKDVKADDWFAPYIKYGEENKIISGYADKTFRPNKTVNLVEALKIIFGVYEIPLWQGETVPWFKLYMDKAFELGLLGRGLDDAGHELTRAELVDIVNDVYNNADNSSWNYY